MTSSILLIKGGRLVDPSTGADTITDILVQDGKVTLIEKDIKPNAFCEVINASGKVVVPGLIDMHVHLRDPGREDKETIESGSRAAALGGFTSIACMANTDPIADNNAVIEYIVKKARSGAAVNVFPIGAVTKELKGSEIAEFGRMIEAGAVAFSDDGKCVMDTLVLRHALEYLRPFKKVIISHCEDHALSEGGHMNESYLSTIMGLKGIPTLAEEAMVQRDISLAREFGRIHIAHVSTARSVELIRQAKGQGIPVTCETAPHYFTLTQSAVENYNTNAKMNPPLRGEADVAAIIEGLKDGTIDCIASDHAPHTMEEKNVEFAIAANGIIGLETTLGLVISELVDTKILTLKDAISKMTLYPTMILGINKGSLKPGSDADITIFDAEKEWEVNVERSASKSRNTPFNGWRLKGKVIYTIVGGKIVVKDGVLTA